MTEKSYEQWICDLMAIGMSEARAREAAATQTGLSDGDVIDQNISRQCITCAYLFRFDTSSDSIACLAFPEGIPETIITGDFDHSKPYVGDHGLRYQPDKST